MESTFYKGFNFRRFRKTPYFGQLDAHFQKSLEVVSKVLPFRVNEYVLKNLIDWDNVPADPIFQLVFPQKGMLHPDDYSLIETLLRKGASESQVATAVHQIHLRLNPHPAGQSTHNVPELGELELHGMQHKYRETLLYFPKQARSCHAYCTFCFRWPLLTDHTEHQFDNPRIHQMKGYLQRHPEVTDVLFTGGDPMVMGAKVLRRHLEALLEPELEHVRSIRIGTKSLAYWPHRFTTDKDADDILRLFEEVVSAGKHLTVMAHTSHPVELSTDLVKQAALRIRRTGANIRMQSPVVHRINENPNDWRELWREGVKLGLVPYYMFVERDTGPKHYFEVPLVRCLEIYQHAFRRVSGLSRTVRGPSMSAFFGKVLVVDVLELDGEKVFALEYIQAREPEFVGNLFFARFDEHATWFNDLKPARPEDEEYFIFEDGDEEVSLAV